jgi:hypothetical protein
MTRKELINKISEYFSIQELVCPHTYNAFKDRSWQFLDDNLLKTLLIIRRDILNVPLTVNTYHKNGPFTQRGLRCNLCQLVWDKTKANKIYLSAHVNGAGIDFIPSGMTAEQARQKIRDNSDKLPYPIRLENNVTWVHLDVYDYMNGKKINEF